MMTQNGVYEQHQPCWIVITYSSALSDRYLHLAVHLFLLRVLPSVIQQSSLAGVRNLKVYPVSVLGKLPCFFRGPYR